MADYIAPLQRLIEEFRRLPGIGGKTAVRLAFSVVSGSEERAQSFADAILAAKREIRTCSVCCNLSASERCPVCSDPDRDGSVICVVEDARDVMAMERIRDYHGLYHVLGGALSPMNGVTPDALHIKELLSRLSDPAIQEIIIATNPTVEGEATAMYLARLLQPLGLTVTRLAYGIPVGGDLEYADEVTLHRAMEGRRSIL
jgi:recombination protein RecR